MLLSCKKKKDFIKEDIYNIHFYGNEYTLDWHDEFNYTGFPDTAWWRFETGFVRNDEVQYYTQQRKENCWVENGNLSITARNDSFNGHPITSASIETYNKRNFHYGLMVIRAKMPHAGSGTWPALWMKGVNFYTVGWPKCGEIDIMEWVGRMPNVILGSMYAQNDTSTQYTEQHWYFNNDTPAYFSDNFHNYAIVWDSTSIKYFVDDTNYTTFNERTTGANWLPLTLPQYLKINMAMGGLIPPIGGGGAINYANFPYTFKIDYVRYYKPK